MLLGKLIRPVYCAQLNDLVTEIHSFILNVCITPLQEPTQERSNSHQLCKRLAS